MSTVSIEIGGNSIRAMIRTNTNYDTAPVEIGDAAGQIFMPSVFAIDADGQVHVGEDALRWKYYSEFNDIGSIETNEQIFTKSIQSVLELIVGRAKTQGGEEVSRVVMVVPDYYEGQKRFIRNAAAQSGIPQIDFIEVHEALCQRQAYIDDGKYVVVFDMGHQGLNVSLLKRNKSDYEYIATKRMLDLGGFAFDGIVYRDIVEKCQPSMPMDDLCAGLANNELERISVYVKERLTAVEACQCPIPFSTRLYSTTRKEFEAKLASIVGKGFSACQSLVEDNNVSCSEIEEALVWGGSCRIPYILNRCKYLFKEMNPNIQITNCSSMRNSSFLACEGGFIKSGNSSVTISF